MLQNSSGTHPAPMPVILCTNESTVQTSGYSKAHRSKIQLCNLTFYNHPSPLLCERTEIRFCKLVVRAAIKWGNHMPRCSSQPSYYSRRAISEPPLGEVPYRR